MNKTSLQYYCGNCNNILNEIDTELRAIQNIEPCPFCCALLSDSLRKIRYKHHSSEVMFQKASQLPKLTFDIAEIDSILHFLTPNQKICLTGVYTQKLVERLCVRAQLPYRHGGLDSKIMLIDGANSSDLYQCVDFAQQYGLDVKNILSGIISCRTFTVYQLANMIVNDLHDAIKHHDVKIVIITHLLDFFVNDPYVDHNEMQQILKKVVTSLKKIQNCLVVVSLGFPTLFDNMLLQLFSRTLKITQNHNTLSVHIDDYGKSQSILLDDNTLEIIPQH